MVNPWEDEPPLRRGFVLSAQHEGDRGRDEGVERKSRADGQDPHRRRCRAGRMGEKGVGLLAGLESLLRAGANAAHLARAGWMAAPPPMGHSAHAEGAADAADS